MKAKNNSADKTIYVFIDTDVLLNFYEFSKDHLDKLRIFINIKKKDMVKLVLPQQVVDEFKRRREKALRAAVMHLDSFQAHMKSPSICEGTPEIKEIQKHLKALGTLLKTLKKELMKQIRTKSLPADKLMDHIFSKNKTIETTEALLTKARRRSETGNPPGKKGTLGDAINWESILHEVPKGHDLCFIGIDGHFRSDIDPDRFHPFLAEEWANEKHSRVIYYETISELLKDKFPDAKITDIDVEKEKELVVADRSMQINIDPDIVKAWARIAAEPIPPQQYLAAARAALVEAARGTTNIRDALTKNAILGTKKLAEAAREIERATPPNKQREVEE